jgi:hypothetical protein
MNLDPIASPIGLVVLLIGLRIVFGAFKTFVKVLFVFVILAGVYLFFYGGTLT